MASKNTFLFKAGMKEFPLPNPLPLLLGGGKSTKMNFTSDESPFSLPFLKCSSKQENGVLLQNKRLGTDGQNAVWVTFLSHLRQGRGDP